jgi:small subunit ribosomal protein S9
MATTTRYYYGLGRRKTAVAQVRLFPDGKGSVTINGKVIESPSPVYLEPLKLAGKMSSDITVVVSGGGFQGQLEAIRHGISRALVVMDEGHKLTLKQSGLLTRDPRAKERKKYGLKSARRAPQWSKR